ncbi:hypothetical protein JTB14_025650 [Gonioctena quinquepunctata]|nr:hypothetical protein JTB14_025650 [Gonioctena quinquepunctata]
MLIEKKIPRSFTVSGDLYTVLKKSSSLSQSEDRQISEIMEWNLDDPKQAEEALNYLFSSPENEEADSAAQDQLNVLYTESASRNDRSAGERTDESGRNC